MISNGSLYTINGNRLIRTRKCSFCKNPGHTISHCNDPRFECFKNYLLDIKNTNLYLFNEINENTPENTLENEFNDLNIIDQVKRMEDFLYYFCVNNEENIHMIKSFSCRYCRCRLRSRLEVCINKIIIYLFNLNYSVILNSPYNHIISSQESSIRISIVINSILLNYLISNDIKEDYKLNIKLNYQETFENETIECSICYNDYETNDCSTFNCNHKFCLDCTQQLFQNKHTNCPNCRTNIKEINCYNENAYSILQKKFLI